MKLVVDASVVVKWFVEEDGHEYALAILRRGDDCFAPDIVLSEVAGALDKKIKAGTLEREQAIEAVRAVQAKMTMVAGPKLIEVSLDLAAELNHPVADCLYLACAIEIGATVVSADDKFVARAANAGFSAMVCMLGKENQTRLSPQFLSAREINEIERLAQDVDAVFEFVRGETGKTFGSSGLRTHSLGDLGPAYDSPNYRRLTKHVDALDDNRRNELIALCWLGRGYDSQNWDTLISRAKAINPGNKEDTAYIISKLVYLQHGLVQLKMLSESTKS
ncbi:MAG: type II toxin-antitoxin system VapC family toxin [Bosea sp. (in: a-proteobacteria)]